MARGAKKGEVRNPKGRGASQNKATVEFKEAVNRLIDYATPQMVDWLKDVADEDPNKALDHVYKFAQFGYPLLARAELTGKDGSAIKTEASLPDSDKELLNEWLKQQGAKK